MPPTPAKKDAHFNFFMNSPCQTRCNYKRYSEKMQLQNKDYSIIDLEDLLVVAPYQYK